MLKIKIKKIIIPIILIFIFTFCITIDSDKVLSKIVNTKDIKMVFQDKIVINNDKTLLTIKKSEKTKIINDFTKKDIKNAILYSISNDIWYKGKYSDYYNFQNKKIKFEVYKDNNYLDVIHILFIDKVKNPKYDKQYLYYSITLVKNNGGLSTTEVKFFSTDNLNDARKTLANDCLLYSDNIYFGKSKKPLIQKNITNNDIKRIKKAMLIQLKDDYLEKGEYKAEVVKLSKFDTNIYLVLSNGKTK